MATLPSHAQGKHGTVASKCLQVRFPMHYFDIREFANASLQMALAPVMTGKSPNEARNITREYTAKTTDSGNAHLQAFVSAFPFIFLHIYFALNFPYSMPNLLTVFSESRLESLGSLLSHATCVLYPIAYFKCSYTLKTMGQISQLPITLMRRHAIPSF